MPQLGRGLDLLDRFGEHGHRGGEPLAHLGRAGVAAAEVLLDGRVVGKTPFAGDLPPGEYQLVLISQGRKSFTRTPKLFADEALMIDVELEGALSPHLPLCMAADSRAALRLAALMRTLDGLPQATIARVHGAAYGGGVGLVACCDIAIAASGAKFGLTETKLGLVPAVISPYVIAAIGVRQARRYVLNAELFDAATALRLGLIHEVADADALDARVDAQIDLLLKAGPQAVREAKRLVRTVAQADPTQRAALDASNAELIARLRVSAEGQEGLGAFLDKRKPNWIPPQ